MGLLWSHLKLHWKTLLEYKTSFFLQVIFMILNNLLTLCFWVIFFNKFKTINQWGLNDIMCLHAMTALAYSLSLLFAGSILELSRHIIQGTLDSFLMLPRNTLVLILLSRMRIYACGDFIYGVSLFLMAGITFSKLGLFLLLACYGAVVIIFFRVIVQSFSFFLGDASYLARQTMSSLMTIALYPPTIYFGFSKLILYTVLPAAFVAFIPLTIFYELDPFLFLVLNLYVLSLFLLSYYFFIIGLKRYASSNIATFLD